MNEVFDVKNKNYIKEEYRMGDASIASNNKVQLGKFKRAGTNYKFK